MHIEYLGFAAGSLTTFCWLPQAVKTLRTRATRDISLTTQLAFTAGCFLWTIYGFMIGSASVAIFNVFTTLLAGLIAVMKIRFG